MKNVIWFFLYMDCNLRNKVKYMERYCSFNEEDLFNKLYEGF